jgi:hypothetical protein
MITMKKSLITSITPGQIAQVGNFVADLGRKTAMEVLDKINRAGQGKSCNVQRLLASGKKIKPALARFLQDQIMTIAMGQVGCLKLISAGKKVVIKATSGKRTIAAAGKTFPGWIDPDYKNYGCNVTAEARPETPTDVYEMIEDGDFRKIFGSFGENLDRLCLTQDQIIEFVESHIKWLRTEGYATLFLFKVGTDCFVARVYFFDDGQLRARVRRFSYDDVWRAKYRHRIVVPQL